LLSLHQGVMGPCPPDRSDTGFIRGINSFCYTDVASLVTWLEVPLTMVKVTAEENLVAQTEQNACSRW